MLTYPTSSNSHSTQKMFLQISIHHVTRKKKNETQFRLRLSCLFTYFESCHIELWPRNFCAYCGCAHLYQGTHALQGRSWSFQCHFSSCFTENTLHVDHQTTNRAIPRVSSVKTRLIYCHLKWRNVLAQESSSGQLLNYVWGTSSESALFWDPKMFIIVRERGYN